MRYVLEHPEHAAFGVLNACRILYSVRRRDVVVSKYAAAQWAVGELPVWRDLITAAVRSYTGQASAAEAQGVREGWAPFVAFVQAETGLPSAVYGS